LGAPSPRPLALDNEGYWFDSPALVMTRLPGRAEVNRINGETYLRQVASAMARLHGACLQSDGLERFDAQPSHIWAPPARRPRSRLLARAQQLIEQTRAREPQPVLIHGDFYSGNLLWHRGRLTGIVDWLSLSHGPRAFDVANCRCDLALLSGSRAAECSAASLTRAIR